LLARDTAQLIGADDLYHEFDWIEDQYVLATSDVAGMVEECRRHFMDVLDVHAIVPFSNSRVL
jgi:hypothetical protein